MEISIYKEKKFNPTLTRPPLPTPSRRTAVDALPLHPKSPNVTRRSALEFGSRRLAALPIPSPLVAALPRPHSRIFGCRSPQIQYFPFGRHSPSTPWLPLSPNPNPSPSVGLCTVPSPPLPVSPPDTDTTAAHKRGDGTEYSGAQRDNGGAQMTGLSCYSMRGPGWVVGPRRDRGWGLIWPRMSTRGRGWVESSGVGGGDVPAQPAPDLPHCYL